MQVFHSVFETEVCCKQSKTGGSMGEYSYASVHTHTPIVLVYDAQSLHTRNFSFFKACKGAFKFAIKPSI